MNDFASRLPGFLVGGLAADLFMHRQLMLVDVPAILRESFVTSSTVMAWSRGCDDRS
jgi:hypothetical protein